VPESAAQQFKYEQMNISQTGYLTGEIDQSHCTTSKGQQPHCPTQPKRGALASVGINRRETQTQRKRSQYPQALTQQHGSHFSAQQLDG